MSVISITTGKIIGEYRIFVDNPFAENYGFSILIKNEKENMHDDYISIRAYRQALVITQYSVDSSGRQILMSTADFFIQSLKAHLKNDR